MFDKAKEALGEHGDKVGAGVDKANDFVDDRTGGRFSDQLDTGAEALKGQFGGNGEHQQGGDRESRPGDFGQSQGDYSDQPRGDRPESGQGNQPGDGSRPEDFGQHQGDSSDQPRQGGFGDQGEGYQDAR